MRSFSKPNTFNYYLQIHGIIKLEDVFVCFYKDMTDDYITQEGAKMEN